VSRKVQIKKKNQTKNKEEMFLMLASKLGIIHFVKIHKDDKNMLTITSSKITMAFLHDT
jgi:hypothetical protein